ncbi:Uncharacterized conserved protein, DUF2141 family [Sphingomonas sp. OV641]|uniref:DUF2141 domain-containing protein n=1 Tax=Sphingomonas sp. OV641 TaxID=1881068 RepID=UPI0008B6A231|nr:DUF2141 domain-containing protein [Sphingomonas sp. OV641]SEJ64334.1 Uncharacterized conserved protein, DUF2141 family [Sphingomonas sp. OV641]
MDRVTALATLKAALLPLLLLGPTTPAAAARVIGSDAAACVQRDQPALEVSITGLKDRTGNLKLELFPATEEDFLKDDRDLTAQGRFFHRVLAPTPANGAITMCIKAPAPGRYALFVTHDRDNKNKFNVWTDGAGIASNQRIGRSRPKLSQSIVNIPRGVGRVTIQIQYLRGLIPSFGPVGD